MLLLKEVNVLLIRYFIVLKTFLNLVQIVLTSSDLVYSIYSLFSVLLVADCYHLDDCLHNRWFQTHGDSEQRVRIRTEHRLSVQRL